MYNPAEHPYPSVRYHVSGAHKTVSNPAEEPEGEDWGHTPFPQAVRPVVNAVEKALAEQRQMFDTSWGEIVGKYDGLREAHETLKAEHEALKEAHAALQAKPAEAPAAEPATEAKKPKAK